MNASEKLRNLRVDRDIKQKEIAYILNCEQSAISKYECGRAKYNLEDLKKLCLFYRVSADYILDLPRNLPYPDR